MTDQTRKSRHTIDPGLKTSNVGTKAVEVVHGDRNKHYGHPKDNHGCTATLWSGYVRKKLGRLADVDGKISVEDIALTMRDVCHLNTLQKIARDAHAEKEDNLVDICGWTLNAEIVSKD